MLDNIKDLFNFVVMIDIHYNVYICRTTLSLVYIEIAIIYNAFLRIENFQCMVYASDIRCRNCLRMDRYTFSRLCSMHVTHNRQTERYNFFFRVKRNEGIIGKFICFCFLSLQKNEKTNTAMETKRYILIIFLISISHTCEKSKKLISFDFV